MSTNEKQGEKTESRQESNVAKPEHAGKEAVQHMPELVKDRKQLAEFLKAGGQSGISHDFGKPTFVDSAKGKGGEKQGKPEGAADAPAQKTADALTPKEHDQLAAALSAGGDAKPADLRESANSERSELLLKATVSKTEGGSDSPTSAFAQIQGLEHSKGEVQIGKEHYQVREGKLYHETKNILGRTHVDEKPSGELQQDGKIKFSDGKAGDLNKQDCLVSLTDANGVKHDILSAGGRQLDLGQMREGVKLRAEGVEEAQQKYHEHKPFTTDFANALAKQMGGKSLDDCVDQTSDNFNNAKKQFDKMNEDLMSGKVKGNDLATMARALSVTATGLEDLAYDQHDAVTNCDEAQKVAKDFVIDSGTTVATAGVGATLQAALKTGEVATSLNAAMKAKEAWAVEQGAEGLGHAQKLIVSAAKGTVQGTGNVMKEYEEGKTTAGDAAMAFGSGLAGEVIPGQVAEGVKEKIFGEALEEAIHRSKQVTEQSNAAVRMIERASTEKEIGVLNAAGKVTEKPVEEAAKKGVEESMKSEQAIKQEEAKKAEEEAKEKEKEAAGEKESKEQESGEKSSQESAQESAPTMPPANAEKAEAESKEQSADQKQEEEKKRSESGN